MIYKSELKKVMKHSIKKLPLQLLPYIVVFILILVCVRQCSNNADIKKQLQHNIETLTDSVKHYRTVSGDIAAEKAILIGDIDLLKQTNDSLYRKVKELGIKKPGQVVYITNEIIREKHDTAWKVLTPEMSRTFDFSDKWRDLTGNVTLKDSILGLSINKDIVRMDYTMCIKDNRVYISSSNPYVKFNEIQGITIPKTKQKHWHVGPTIGVDIGTDGVIRPNLSLGLTYSIVSF